MKFNITHDYLEKDTDSCIITGVFQDSRLFPSTNRINKISQGYILSLLKRNIFNGSIKQTLLLYDAPYFLNKRILLIGCGKENEFSPSIYREILHKTIEICQSESISKILFLLSELDIAGYDNFWKIRHSIQILNQGTYIFNMFKHDKSISKKILNDITMYIPNTNNFKNYKKAVNIGLSIAEEINIAKNLSNMPPNYCTPIYLAEQVQNLTNEFTDLDIQILDESQIKKLGMNAYLSVGKGSHYPAVMPIIKYQKHPNGPNFNPVILIGKGLTFDSGGISIKSSYKMDEMKYDMCGAAVVYAIMRIVAKLKIPLNIIGILAISENMISNKSLRPGDILTTLSGKTVEVLNTDAEGRLVLCDVLTYVERYNPSIVIDIATLTGACVVALGNHFSGLMSNNEKLVNDLMFASNQTKDYIWRLPLHKIFMKQLKSCHADIANIGGQSGSVITAACFLQQFAHKYHWAHLDIAGTAWKSNFMDKNATGRPVELLSQFLLNTSDNEYNEHI